MMTPFTPCVSGARRSGGSGSAGTFKLRVAETGLRVMVHVTGPLDVEHAAEFLEQVRPLCRPSRRMLLDLRRVPFIDSAGVRSLLSLKAELEEQDGDLRLLIEPASRVERALRLLRLEQHFGTVQEPALETAGSPLLRAA